MPTPTPLIPDAPLPRVDLRYQASLLLQAATQSLKAGDLEEAASACVNALIAIGAERMCGRFVTPAELERVERP